MSSVKLCGRFNKTMRGDQIPSRFQAIDAEMFPFPFEVGIIRLMISPIGKVVNSKLAAANGIGNNFALL